MAGVDGPKLKERTALPSFFETPVTSSYLFNLFPGYRGRIRRQVEDPKTVDCPRGPRSRKPAAYQLRYSLSQAERPGLGITFGEPQNFVIE